MDGVSSPESEGAVLMDGDAEMIDSGKIMRSWGFSVVLHAAVCGLGWWLISQQTIVLPPTFQWDVSLVGLAEPHREGQRSEALVQRKDQFDRAIKKSVRQRTPPVPTPIPSQVIDSTKSNVQETPVVPPTQPTIPQDHNAEPQPRILSDSAPLAQEQADDGRPGESRDAQLEHTFPHAQQDESPAGSEVQSAQPAVLSNFVVQGTTSERADNEFSWLMNMLWDRVMGLKRYPHEARMNRWEGRVVVRVVLNEQGQLLEAAIATGSGHDVLDQAALEIIRRACPLSLPHALGRSQVVLRVPIQYRLDS
jgi:periplasmic protein TonB